ncbi:MAG: hypothetical protein ACYDER_14955 [Ktedonobacteraceae bacterium]
MRLHFLRISVVVPILLLLCSLTVGAAGAASAAQTRHSSHPVYNQSTISLVLRSHRTVHISTSVLNTSQSGTHYLYIDDGTCPDSIDVYKTGATLTHVGNYPNNGCTGSIYFGATTLAIAPTNSNHGNCLIFADTAGFVDSFPINSDGSLGAEISHLQDYAQQPLSAVAIADNGIAYVSAPQHDLESYSISAGCILTFLHATNTNSAGDIPFYASITPIGNNLVGAESSGSVGSIDTFRTDSAGDITPLNVVHGQTTAAASVVYETILSHKITQYRVFVGYANPGPASIEGGPYNVATGAITFMNGSPSFDPRGNNGGSLFMDTGTRVVIQGEQYSGTLGNYSVRGPTMSFIRETQMAVSGEYPNNFVQLGSTLFVNMIINGDIEACSLGISGATGCKSVAVLTNTAGFSPGMALL